MFLSECHYFCYKYTSLTNHHLADLNKNKIASTYLAKVNNVVVYVKKERAVNRNF